MYEGGGGYDEGDDDDDFGTDSWVSTGDIIKTQPAETSINNNRLILSCYAAAAPENDDDDDDDGSNFNQNCMSHMADISV